MASEKFVLIQDRDLTNNCPECFNQDLKLTFYQKHVYGRFSHRVTSEVSNQIRCNKCGSDIYPAKWTEDIERTYKYYNKMVQPEKTSLKLKPLFYMLTLIPAILITTVAYLYYAGVIQF